MSAVLALAACEQETEGCLDFGAVQVDFDADRPCGDCCEYPNARVDFIPFVNLGDSTSILARENSALAIGADSVTPLALAFYAHDVRLRLADGSAVDFADTLRVRRQFGEELELADVSVQRVSPLAEVSVGFGRIRPAGEVVALEMTLGLPEGLRDVDPRNQPAASPLGVDGARGLLDRSDSSRVFAAYAAAIVEGGRDSVTVAAGETAELSFPISGDLDAELLPSFNVVVELRLSADALGGLVTGEIDAGAFAELFFAEAVVTNVQRTRG